MSRASQRAAGMAVAHTTAVTPPALLPLLAPIAPATAGGAIAVERPRPVSDLPSITGDCMHCGSTHADCQGLRNTKPSRRSEITCCTLCSATHSHPLLDPADTLDIERMSHVELRVARLLLTTAERGMGMRTLADEVADRARALQVGAHVELVTERLEHAGLAYFAAGSGVLTATGEKALRAIKRRLDARPEVPTHA